MLQRNTATENKSEIPASDTTGPKSDTPSPAITLEPTRRLTSAARQVSFNAEVAARPRLSLCIIVRNNETTIGPCLESIRPWVGQIAVVDTGSTDKTLEICRQYGAEVYTFPWCDDFSAARNESLKYARGEWIFWMDSDDTITPECGQKLRALVDGPHAENVIGYVMQVHCPGPSDDGLPDVTAVDHVKLIRNRPDLRFEGRIHEQLLPAIRRAGGEVAWTDIYVVHSGSDHSPEGFQRKLERDLRILNLEFQEHPDHPFVLFNLGMTYADAANNIPPLGRVGQGAEYYPHFLRRSASAPRRISDSFSMPRQRVIQPGSPSHLRPRWPPRPASSRINSRIVMT